jgi:hypothetical protein
VPSRIVFGASDPADELTKNTDVAYASFIPCS